MDLNLIESLLWSAESESLDFKSEQYPFAGATDEQKSELLKDILAFANSWRQTTAYILIGVEEVKGGRSIIRGVSGHLEDSALQQFVSGKTQRPVNFTCEAFEFEGKGCAVISVPVQERPTYLLKKYGKLDANVVYIRRGSSTDQAKPDEIKRVGHFPAEAPLPHFEIQIQPRLESRGNYQLLEVASWLRNLGPGTADDVIVVLQHIPHGMLGLDPYDWKDVSTSFPGAARAFRRPLNPGEMVFIFSESLGVATWNDKTGAERSLVVKQESASFKIKVLARNVPPIEFWASFSRGELTAMVRKKYLIGKPPVA